MDQWGHQERSGWAAADEDAPTLRVPKTAELVADHFRSQICDGHLFEGEFLPPEAALTDALGIARPTLPKLAALEGLERQLSSARTALDAGALDTALARMNSFHVMLVEAAGNAALALFAVILRRLLAVQQSAIGSRQRARAQERGPEQERALRSCATLLAIIAAGDAAPAVAHWRFHLAASNAIWLANGEGEMVVEVPPPR